MIQQFDLVIACFLNESWEPTTELLVAAVVLCALPWPGSVSYIYRNFKGNVSFKKNFLVGDGGGSCSEDPTAQPRRARHWPAQKPSTGRILIMAVVIMMIWWSIMQMVATDLFLVFAGILEGLFKPKEREGPAGEEVIFYHNHNDHHWSPHHRHDHRVWSCFE